MAAALVKPRATPQGDRVSDGRMARRAGTVALFTLGSRILGYVRDLTLAYSFGAGAALDAFVAAQTIPNVFRRLVAEGTLMVAFVPMLAEARQRAGKPGMRALVSAVLGVLLPVLVAICALGMVFPGVFVDAFAGGFEPERHRLAQAMTRIMMPFLGFVSLVAVAGGALNSEGVFGPPAAAPILLNVGIIATVLFAAGWVDPPILAAAWGVAAGGLLQWALQIPFLMRHGFWVRPRWDPGNPELRRLLVRIAPAVLGVGVYQLNVVVIRQLASTLPRGQLSWYFYANRLEEFALGVFAVSISIAALPTLSEHAAAGRAEAFRRTFAQAIRATQFITVPAMLVLAGLAEPIVATLFQHGRFSPEAASATQQLLRIMALALVPIGAIRVVVPTYYAVGDTRWPVVAALGSLLTTAGLGVALLERYQIWGLVVATTAAACVQAALLALWLPARVFGSVGVERNRAVEPDAVPPGPTPEASLVSILGHGLRCMLAAVLPVGAVVFACRYLVWDQVPALMRAGALAGSMLVAGVGYFAVAAALRIEEVGLLRRAIVRRISR